MGSGLTKDDIKDALEQAITSGKITPDLDKLIESFHKDNKTAIQAILKDIKEDDKNKIEKILNEQIKIIQESIIKDAEERHTTQMESKDAEKDRLKSDYEQELRTLKEEKKEKRIRLLKEKETELMALRAEIKEDKKRNEEAKTESEKRMAEEKTKLMQAHANDIQIRENNLKERENIMRITHQERLDLIIKEKEEREKQHERLIHMMREDSETMKKEKDEQIEKHKEENEQMRQKFERELQQIKEDRAKEMGQLKQDHKQSLESTHNMSEQQMETLVRLLKEHDQDRNQQIQEMMSQQKRTTDYLMETNKIYQQVTLGLGLQAAHRFSLLQQTRPCPGIGPSSISLPRAHLTHVMQDQQSKLKKLITGRENKDNESAGCVQTEMPPSASEESSPATWEPNAIPSGCETDDAAFKQHQTSDCQKPNLRTKHRQTDGKTPDVDNDSDSSKPFADTDEKLDVTNPQPHVRMLDSDQNNISPGFDTLGNNSSAKSDNLNQRSVSVSESQDEHSTISVAVPMQRPASQESGVPGNSSAAPESRANESKEPDVSTAGTQFSMLEDKYDSFEVINSPTSNDSSYDN